MHGYTPPQLNEPSFTCPHCGVYALHAWGQLLTVRGHGVYHPEAGDPHRSICARCRKPTIWFMGEMIYPLGGTAPLPNPDLPETIKADYLEARSIAALSPRGAAALLRLAIDKLTTDLGAKGKNINDRIGYLVVKGLDVRVQQMLDSVRVVGNESVHPGQIDLRDDPELAGALFWLVNEIADEIIAKPNRIKAVYAKLPEEKRKGIEARDRKTS